MFASGYAYIYLSNENDKVVEVYFDDLKIIHLHSPVQEATDYYPFGAIAASYERIGDLPNHYKYQSKEYQEDLDLNLYDFHWRQYDPWINRTTTMDPHAENYYQESPYSWSANNTIKLIDPNGKDWYLNLYSGQVQFMKGDESHFNQGYVHLAGDGASVGEIRDALNARGYNYVSNANIPGGYQVDTRMAYKGWLMMQTFSETNVGTILWMGANAFTDVVPERAARGIGSVWGFNQSQRGFMIERALGGNLPNNFPVIDKLSDCVATSIKSMDLSAKSYSSGNAVFNTLKGYINTLSNFTRGQAGGVVAEQGVNFESKAIEVAIQPGKASVNQWEQIGKAMQYAKDQGIEFKLKFFK